MTRVVRAVRPGDPVMFAVRLMADENVHRVVVVDDDGKLAGIVSAMDVLRALARGNDVQGHDPVFLDRHERHADPAIVTEYVDLDQPRGGSRTQRLAVVRLGGWLNGLPIITAAGSGRGGRAPGPARGPRP